MNRIKVPQSIYITFLLHFSHSRFQSSLLDTHKPLFSLSLYLSTYSAKALVISDVKLEQTLWTRSHRIDIAGNDTRQLSVIYASEQQHRVVWLNGI